MCLQVQQYSLTNFFQFIAFFFFYIQSIIATVYGSRNSIVCQAHGSVIVGVPSSAILNAQSEQLAVGREMPIYPFFPEVRITVFN